MEEPPITSKTLAYIIFGLIFTGFCLLLLYIIASESTNIAEIPNGLESYIFIQRFLNNPECFTYQDKDTQRIYPGVIDFEKFNQENLDKCYPVGKVYVSGFKLTINDKPIQSSNFEFSKQKIVKNILIFKEGKFENAKLYIEYEEK